MQREKAFSGELASLSNMHPAPIVVDGVVWPSSEHFYQAHKSPDPEVREAIRTASTPGKAKRMGGKIDTSEWPTAQRVAVMRTALDHKFRQNPDLAEKLLATGDQHLEERNYWGDRFWGTVEGEGDNRLGLLLMEIRNQLRKEPSCHAMQQDRARAISNWPTPKQKRR